MKKYILSDIKFVFDRVANPIYLGVDINVMKNSYEKVVLIIAAVNRWYISNTLVWRHIVLSQNFCLKNKHWGCIKYSLNQCLYIDACVAWSTAKSDKKK